MRKNIIGLTAIICACSCVSVFAEDKAILTMSQYHYEYKENEAVRVNWDMPQSLFESSVWKLQGQLLHSPEGSITIPIRTLVEGNNAVSLNSSDGHVEAIVLFELSGKHYNYPANLSGVESAEKDEEGTLYPVKIIEDENILNLRTWVDGHEENIKVNVTADGKFLKPNGVPYAFKWIGIPDIDETRWYRTKSDGSLVTGWKEINGRTYFFDQITGQMYTGKKILDNVERTFLDNGVLIK